jgi:hypothetical protein
MTSRSGWGLPACPDRMLMGILDKTILAIPPTSWP